MAPRTLSSRAAGGFLWMLFQTLGSKLVGLVAQIFLARLLEPKDFGLVAIAYMVLAIPSMLRQSGIGQILVQKGPRLERWGSSAFWLDLALGALSTAVMLGLAPIAARAYHTPELFGLISLVASAAFFNSAMVLPTAILNRDLRFREMAAVGMGYNFLAAALSVLFAYCGLGAYSFVLPLPICLALRCVVLFCLTRPRIRWGPQPHRWRALAPDSLRMLSAGFFAVITVQFDVFSLSLFDRKSAVGQYAFASNLSGQVLTLMAINLGSVLFPVLSKIANDAPRQTAAFLRACRALALIGIPLCLGEALLARPGVRVVFGAKWHVAAMLLSVLACAAAIKLVGGSAGSLLLAQGRYHTNMVWAIINAVAFCAAVFCGAFFGGATGVAAASLISALLVSPALVWQTVRVGGGNWRDVSRVYVPPVIISAVALLPAWLLVMCMRAGVTGDIIQVAVGLLSAPPIYLLLACKFMPADVAELAAHLGPIGRILRRLHLISA